eukprot:8571782-Alexandrium_andersonii.AAC.1
MMGPIDGPLAKEVGNVFGPGAGLGEVELQGNADATADLSDVEARARFGAADEHHRLRLP